MNTGRIITTALAASILAIPAMAADAPGYFKVPGTETTLKIYGKAETEAYYHINNASTTVNTVPGANTHQSTNETGTVSATAYGRFGFDSITPSSYGDVHVKLEYEAAGNDYGSNDTNAAALRYAYGEFAGLLVGQTDSLFKDIHFGIGANDTERAAFNGCKRIEQIRYTLNPAKGVTVAFSSEKSGDVVNDENKAGAQLVGAFRYAADWGGVAASVGQQKRRNWSKTLTTSASGVSYAVSGQYNITANDVVAARFVKGALLMGPTGGAWDLSAADGKEKLYKVTSMDLGYTHTWNSSLSSSLGVAKIVAPKNEDLGEVKRTETEMFLNTSWSMTKTVTLTAEYYNSSIKFAEGQPILKYNGNATNKANESNINLYLTYTLF